MVIGNGAIAKIFKDLNNDNYIIFASGVSNSQEKNYEEFKREENLLKEVLKKNPDKIIVYFSTVSIYTKKTKYTQHKIRIENILKKNSNFIILRIPQLLSSIGNKNNLINFIFNKIKNEQEIFIEKNSERSILDVDDLKKITLFLINKNIKNKCYNFSGFEFIKVIDIVRTIESILNKKAKIIITNKNSKIYKHNSLIFRDFLINLKTSNYIKNTLKKYITLKIND